MAPPAGEALNVCPRPVFWEELDFYHLYEYGWSYPHSNNPLLWACDRRYYYKGQVVLEVNGGNLFDIPKINVLQANLQVKEIDIDFLKKINEDSMFLIEHEAMSFIFQTYTSHISIINQRTVPLIYLLTNLPQRYNPRLIQNRLLSKRIVVHLTLCH